MGDQYNLYLLRMIRAQSRFKACQINRSSLAKIQKRHIDTHRLSRSRPAKPKMPCGQHQRLIPARKKISVGRLPCSVTIANIHGQMMRCACHYLKIGLDLSCDINNLSFINIGGCTLHSSQHTVRHNRRPGDCVIMTALSNYHGGLLFITANPSSASRQLEQ